MTQGDFLILAHISLAIALLSTDRTIKRVWSVIACYNVLMAVIKAVGKWL